MAALSTIALATLGTGFLTKTMYDGREAKKEQGRALDEQRRAQSIAQADAASARRRAAMDTAKANQKAPDVGTLLSNAQAPAAGGTLLTGAAGIDPRRLKLGQSSSLLGT